MTKKLYTMKEACEKTGLTYDTLKFYCDKNLVPFLKRDKNNRRTFTNNNLAWLESLKCLKRCGMSIEEIKTYLDSALRGESTILERKAMLEQKEHDIHRQIAELEQSLEFIAWKKNLYDDFITGRRKYYTNLRED
ncbi:MAG: MerR family transcriptional regulator [Candidatus Saccharibacteria bacterium]|nr:MerR family transcriptional regulator [Candidatus Saccharibacteria bacterium]